MSKISLLNEDIEKLLCAKLYYDDSYRIALRTFYDKRWFENKNIAILIKIAFNYSEKYGCTPRRETLEPLLNKLAKSQTSNTIVVDEILLCYDEAINMDKTINEESFKQDSIFDFIHQKSIYFSIIDNIDELEQKEKLAALVESFQKILNLTLDTDLGFNFKLDYENHLKRLASPLARLSTGISSIDEQTGGGLLKEGKCLFVPMGMPGIGKSQIICNFAVNHARDGGVPLIISLEMSEDLYGQRIDALISDIEINSIHEESQEVLNSINTFFGNNDPLANIIIKEYPPSTINSNVIENYIKKLHLNNIHPTLLLVDYIGLMEPNAHAKNAGMYERGSEVAKNLRALSYKFRIPVVAPAQTNRCLDLNTKVELENNKFCAIGELEKGQKIKGLNGFVEVKKIYPIQKQQVYKITTESGKSIICSDNHIFPTPYGLKSIKIGLNVGVELFTDVPEKIVKIEKLDNRCTIDIEVSDDNLFFANDILTHNSGYSSSDVDLSDIAESAGINQTADAIMAIYENDQDRSNGLINVVFRKNRLGGIINKPITLNSNRRTLLLSDTRKQTTNKVKQTKDLMDELDDL